MEEYDLIIIGGGCAGYPAAVYASRFNLKTKIIASLKGGLITTTHLVENYPGFISLSGQELADKLEKQVEANNVPIENDLVKSIETIEENGKKYFIVKTDYKENEYKTKAVILATGTKHRHLDVPGEKEFANKGVSYCATCDGMFFRNKTVAIVGGSDSAAKEAMVLAQNSKKVYMFVRSHIKAEPINADRIRKIENIEIIEGIQVKEIHGEQKVTHVTLDKEHNGSNRIDLDGLFIAVGMLPQNDLAKQVGVELNKGGEIIIDRISRTNVPGVLAAGDVTDMPWKQGVIGSAEGSAAAYAAFEYIQENFTN